MRPGNQQGSWRARALEAGGSDEVRAGGAANVVGRVLLAVGVPGPLSALQDPPLGTEELGLPSRASSHFILRFELVISFFFLLE